MLSQQERIELFKKAVEELEKQYEFTITGVLQITPQGIIPGVTLVDNKPAFSGVETQNTTQTENPQPPSNNVVHKTPLEKN